MRAGPAPGKLAAMGIEIAAQGRLEDGGRRSRMIDRILTLASEHFGPLAGPPIRSDEAGSILLCPSSDSLIVAIDDEGTVEIGCRTSPVGPGFHREVCRLLDVIADAGVEWTTVEDDTGYYASRDNAALEVQFSSWLGSLAKQLAQAVPDEDTAVLVCMPVGTHFTAPAEYITPFGPISRTELDAITADPANSPWMPWPLDVPHAVLFLRTALSVMWCDVRWRPLIAQEEDEEGVESEARGAAAHALSLLDAAFEADPDLDYPWHEWAELAEFHDRTSPGATEAESRRAVTPEPETPIGFRRHDVVIQAPACAIQVAGSATWSIDDEVMTIWDGEHTMRISGYLAAPEDAGDQSRVLERAWENFEFEGDQIGDLFQWQADDAAGRVRTARSDDGEFVESTGIIAGPSSFCLVSIYFDDQDQIDDAMEIFKSVRPQAAEESDAEQE